MNDPQQQAEVRSWLIEPMPTDVARSINRLSRTDDIQFIAIMPDVHLARDVCIGTAIATSKLVYPLAVGSDIGCGMAAMRFNGVADIFHNEQNAGRLLSGLYQRVPSNRHSAKALPRRLSDSLTTKVLSHPKLEKLKHRDGRVQFGTLGRGNHFLELQADEENRLWAMVHSGSRAMGQAITAHHLDRIAPSLDGLPSLVADSPEGKAYLSDVVWAISYAEKNRLAMLTAVARLFEELFGMTIDHDSLIHANHNHVRREVHFGREYWIHRKGAQSAREGEPGIIPGSMGTASFHVTGRGCDESLCSSSHGAGRKMSRTDARSTISQKQLDQQMGSVWFDHRRAKALRDEAPGAYKDIHAVMRAQKKLTRITRELQPVLSYKGV
jgi:tRNA-splicing ligase RtcB (3'-phosphate/5'-hydroxy nucleic acid ligase)